MDPTYSLKYLNTLDRLALVKLCKSHNILDKGASDALKLRLADLGKLTVRGKAAGRQTTSSASKGSSTRVSSTRMKTRNARAVEEHDTTIPLPRTHPEQPPVEAEPLRLVRNEPQLCARTPSSKVARLAATSPISTAKRHTRASSSNNNTEPTSTARRHTQALSSNNNTEPTSTARPQRRRQIVIAVVRPDSEATGASSVSSSERGEQHVFDEIELDILHTIEVGLLVKQCPLSPDTTHTSNGEGSSQPRSRTLALESSLLAARCDDAQRADGDSGGYALGYTQPPLSFCRGEDAPQDCQPDSCTVSYDSTLDDSSVLVEAACDTIMADDESVEPESEDDDDMELIIGHPRAVTPTLTYMVDPPAPPPPPTSSRPPLKPDTPVFTYTLRTRASYRPLVPLPRKYPLAQLPKYRRLERESDDVRVYCLARNEQGVRGEQKLSLDHAPWLAPPQARKRGKRRNLKT